MVAQGLAFQANDFFLIEVQEVKFGQNEKD